MNSVSETLINIFKRILSVVAAFYLLFGIKMEFTRERFKKNFDENKKLIKNTTGQIAAVIFSLLMLFFHFCVPDVSLLCATAVSFLFSFLAFTFVMVPVVFTEAVLNLLKSSYYVRQSSTAFYFLNKTTFKPVFIPVPTSPPRFNLAA
ncbi:MAG: hypothetical protein ABL920_00010 [Methylotenera sp.]|nr:hypothetical protein [Methylotenera sp.]